MLPRRKIPMILVHERPYNARAISLEYQISITVFDREEHHKKQLEHAKLVDLILAHAVLEARVLISMEESQFSDGQIHNHSYSQPSNTAMATTLASINHILKIHLEQYPCSIMLKILRAESPNFITPE